MSTILELDQSDHHVVDEDGADTDHLVEHLAGVAFDETGCAADAARRICRSGSRRSHAADCMHAESVERVVVTEQCLSPVQPQ